MNGEKRQSSMFFFVSLKIYDSFKMMMKRCVFQVANTHTHTHTSKSYLHSRNFGPLFSEFFPVKVFLVWQAYLFIWNETHTQKWIVPFSSYGFRIFFFVFFIDIFLHIQWLMMVMMMMNIMKLCQKWKKSTCSCVDNNNNNNH